MNNIALLFIASIISINSFSQSKKSLLKEIVIYKNNTIKEASFNTSEDSLKVVCSQFFKQNNYTFHSTSDTGLVYTKQLMCFGEEQFPQNAEKKKTRHIYRNHFVTVHFVNSHNKYNQPKIMSFLSSNYPNKLSYNKAVNSGGTYAFKVGNNPNRCFYNGKLFYFSEFDLQKHLYIHFKGNNILFSKKLINKIENYNTEQTKEKKQLIAGRDF